MPYSFMIEGAKTLTNYHFSQAQAEAKAECLSAACGEVVAVWDERSGEMIHEAAALHAWTHEQLAMLTRDTRYPRLRAGAEAELTKRGFVQRSPLMKVSPADYPAPPDPEDAKANGIKVGDDVLALDARYRRLWTVVERSGMWLRLRPASGGEAQAGWWRSDCFGVVPKAKQL